MDDPGARPDPLAVPESGQSGQRVTRLALPDKAPRQDPHRAALRAGAESGLLASARFGLFVRRWVGWAGAALPPEASPGLLTHYDGMPVNLAPSWSTHTVAGVRVVRQRLVVCR